MVQEGEIFALIGYSYILQSVSKKRVYLTTVNLCVTRFAPTFIRQM